MRFDSYHLAQNFCASGSFLVDLAIENPDPAREVDGAIIQHIVRSPRVTDCLVAAVTPHHYALDFYEAWRVEDGNILNAAGNPAATDRFGFAEEPGQKSGSIRITGKIAFVPDYAILQPPWVTGYQFARDLYARFTVPEGWSDSNAADHIFEVSFTCCCGIRNRITRMVPGPSLP